MTFRAAAVPAAGVHPTPLRRLGGIVDDLVGGAPTAPRPPPPAVWPSRRARRHAEQPLAPAARRRLPGVEARTFGQLLAAVPQLQKRVAAAPVVDAVAQTQHSTLPTAAGPLQPPRGKPYPHSRWRGAAAPRPAPRQDRKQRGFIMCASALLKGLQRVDGAPAAPTATTMLDVPTAALVLSYYGGARVAHASLVERVETALMAGGDTVANAPAIVLALTALARLEGSSGTMAWLLARLAAVWSKDSGGRWPEGMALGLWSLHDTMKAVDVLHLVSLLTPLLTLATGVKAAAVATSADRHRVLCLLAALLPHSGSGAHLRLASALLEAEGSNLGSATAAWGALLPQRRLHLLWVVGRYARHCREAVRAPHDDAAVHAMQHALRYAAQLFAASEYVLPALAAAARASRGVLAGTERLLWCYQAAGAPLPVAVRREIVRTLSARLGAPPALPAALRALPPEAPCPSQPSARVAAALLRTAAVLHLLPRADVAPGDALSEVVEAALVRAVASGTDPDATDAVQTLCALASAGRARVAGAGLWVALYGRIVGTDEAAVITALAGPTPDSETCVVADAVATPLEAAAERRVDALPATERVHLLWGLAKVHVHVQRLPGSAALLAALGDTVRDGRVNAKVMAVWAAATFTLRNYVLYEQAVQRLLEAPSGVAVRHLISVSWSLARVKVARPGTDELPRLFKPLREATIPAHHAAVLMWSQHTLRCGDAALCESVRHAPGIELRPRAERAMLARLFAKIGTASPAWAPGASNALPS